MDNTVCFYTAQGDYVCDKNQPIKKSQIESRPNASPAAKSKVQENFVVVNAPVITSSKSYCMGNSIVNGDLVVRGNLCIDNVCVKKNDFLKLANKPKRYWTSY